MPLESFERRGCALKIETVENTDALPTAAANALQMMNGRSGIETDVFERPLDNPEFDADDFTVGKYRGFIEGDVDLVGNAAPGTAAPVGSLLRIGTFAETLDAVGPPAIATYNPISSAIPSASAYFYHAGTLKKILGARATLSQLKMAIGGYFGCRARIEGNCIDIEEAAVPSDFDFSSFQAPTRISTETLTLTVDGFNVDGVELTVDLGTELQVKEHSEARITRIFDRKPTFTMRFYRPLQASLDVHALRDAGERFAIVGLVDSGVAGGLARLTLSAAKIEQIEEIELERDYGYEIRGRCFHSAAGADSVLIDFE